MTITIVPLVSSIVSFIFFLTVLDQYLTRRKPYQLLWAIGLLMYSISAGTEFWTGTWGLNQVVYRLWYLIGAVFVAAYLGMGTVFLLARRKVAWIVLAILLTASLYATIAVFSAEIDLSSLQSLSGAAMPQSVRLMTPFFNSFGTLALVGGALYSAWVFWRRRILPHRVTSNILIALGAILPAFGGIHIRFGGTIPLFYIFELLGIILIFLGFLRSYEVFEVRRIPFVHMLHRVPSE